jgi:uncharacterized protein (DUF1800 family)
MTQNAANPIRELLAPLPDEAFGPAQARHLLLRTGFGGTDEQIRTLVAWGPQRSVDHLVDYEEVPAEPDERDAFNKDIMRPYSPAEQAQMRTARQRQDEDTLARFREMRQQAQRTDRQQMNDIRQWWLARMIQTARPLEEKLTLFWHGHFATSYRSVEDSYHLFQQNRMFRGNAKSYPRLLRGIIRDPAMLRYLNNNQNRRQSPNENLAREIMELFSLGEGNYQERDIKEGARALTGYTFEDDTFIFRQEQHDAGAKFILGSRGAINGDGFVDVLLRHQACAPFIAARLYRFFVADVASQPRDLTGQDLLVVRLMAERLKRDQYEIGPTLKQLFRSRHFYSDAVVGQKIKSPAELVVGAVRTLGVPARDLRQLNDAMDRMGQNLFFPPSVKGWDGGRAWINTATLFVRQNTLAAMITGQQPNARAPGGGVNRIGGDYDPRSVLPMLIDPDRPTDPETIVGALLELALGHRDPRAVETLASAPMVRNAPDARPVLAGLMALITALPEYQLC